MSNNRSTYINPQRMMQQHSTTRERERRRNLWGHYVDETGEERAERMRVGYEVSKGCCVFEESDEEGEGEDTGGEKKTQEVHKPNEAKRTEEADMQDVHRQDATTNTEKTGSQKVHNAESNTAQTPSPNLTPEEEKKAGADSFTNLGCVAGTPAPPPEQP
ncbi:hypothetical protein BDW02DRAFT_602902 [Decorospora gaudefroyi]|uniref:Uncharacterized protein n=1 Tax=Decorospora gaudefroyi TaxID=184978 RepID=A0A6A5K424_9PLEO|nr:hypothetical protein BDW02DRAFT_602902 [Decorospora gaudefroyi]